MKILLFFLYIFTASGNTLQTEEIVGKTLIKNSFFEAPYNCSSFLFKNKTNHIFMGTAHHCFPYGNKKMTRKAYALTSRLKRIRDRYIRYKIESSTSLYNRDLTIVKPISYKDMKVLTLATKKPVYGDKVYVFGYAVKGGQESLKLECIYQGKGAFNMDDRKNILGDIIKCSHDRSSIAGMSGGPILNEAGEVLGILSAEMINEKDDDKSAYPVLFFQELNETMFKNGNINLDNSGSYLFSNYVKNYLDPDNISIYEQDIEVEVNKGLIVLPQIVN